MEHERVEHAFDTKEAVVHFVVDHHDPQQLFQGDFREVVIRHYGDAGSHDVKILQFVEDAGVTLSDARARRRNNTRVAVAWVTPVNTRLLQVTSTNAGGCRGMPGDAGGCRGMPGDAGTP
jgi:hypothetical protein